MAFAFELIDAAEIHRDPGGHYHHWTALMGRLTEGEIRELDYVSVPIAGGQRTVARLIMVEANLRSVPSYRAGDPTGESGQIAAFAWHPAPRQEVVVPGQVEKITARDYILRALEMWEEDPTIFLHCHDCSPALGATDATLDLIQEISLHPDERLAAIAQRSLHYYEHRNDPRPEPERERPWWRFWG